MEVLFTFVKIYGKIVRKNNLNGLDSWNKMKTLLLAIRCDCLVWNIKLKKFNGDDITSIKDAYNYVQDDLGMRGEDNQTEKCNPNWEKFHFFLQLVRIPYNNPDCNLVRLAQVAYNLGQLSAVYDDAVYTKEVKKFYTMNNLNKMSTYTDSSCDIRTEDLEKISQFIDNKIFRARYLQKYLKYKKKYFRKKNNL
jgi:hypothetical protein